MGAWSSYECCRKLGVGGHSGYCYSATLLTRHQLENWRYCHSMCHSPGSLLCCNLLCSLILQKIYAGRDMLGHAILTEQYLLIVRFFEGNMVLSVIDIYSDQPKDETDASLLEELSLVCTLLYPPYAYALCDWATGIRPRILEISCSSSSSSSAFPIPYSPDNTEQVLVVRAYHDAEVISTVIHVSTILRLVQKADKGQRFEWDEWGPLGTRLMNTSSDLLLDVTVFGSTAMVLSWIEEVSSWRLTLLDFGSRGVKKYMAETADDAAHPGLSTQHAYGEGKLFGTNDLITFLPARVSSITPDFGEHNTSQLKGVFLGDDCIALNFFVSGHDLLIVLSDSHVAHRMALATTFIS